MARISFVEGWGPDYPGRDTIDDCRSWIEIKLNVYVTLLHSFRQLVAAERHISANITFFRAFAFLDRLLTEVHGEQLLP